jgi:hypothetical protein
LRTAATDGFLIQERVFASVFTALHIVADATHFGHSAFSARGVELRRFAAKNLQTVENDREKFSGPLNRCAGILRR